jgi:hypothetical protein
LNHNRLIRFNKSPDGHSAVELLQLFGNKTWVWDNGGAFFQSRQRTFRAYSDDDGNRTSAEGRWLLTNAGRLCLQAEWQSVTGNYEELTCFRHVRSGATVYQQKENNGDWYIFVDDGKMPETLVSGEILSNEYATTRQSILDQRR